MRNRSVFSLMLLVGLVPAISAQDDINEAYQAATQAAVRRVAPSVVQIVTQGGAEVLRTGARGQIFRKALGPTTGVIVSPDGYIVSSAFNFINNPTSIFVEVPGRKERYVAKKIATDRLRMLTLLKIDGKDLPVPEVAPKSEIQVGQFCLALGRTLDPNQDNPPSVSTGVVSALGRIWGKCIQTDANTSPVNYGGPLVDLRGRVMGIIIPASPRGTGETAGFEWYDSGIGFAIPMEDVMAVLPRLKQGKDLKPGLLGVRLRSSDLFGGKAIIGQVMPDTAAARAGLKPGDEIIEIEGQKIARIANLKHALGTKYEGDRISLKIRRGGKTIAIDGLELVGQLKALATAFLGILPIRDDPQLGVEVRYVFADSPAAKAGIKAGDRVVKYGLTTPDGKKLLRGFSGKVSGREELKQFLSARRPKDKVLIEVKRKDGKTATLGLELTEFPGSTAESKDAPPKDLPKYASRKKALDPLETPKGKQGKAVKKPKVETGLTKHTTSSGNHQYWLYLDEGYDPNISHALLVWLHPAGKNDQRDMETLIAAWRDYCADKHVVIVAPITEAETGWTPSDLDQVREAIRDAMQACTIDKLRVVTHGLGNGGQMAVHVGLNARDLVRGVAATGAVPTGLKDNVPGQPLQFFIVAGDRDPLVKLIRESRSKIAARKLPAIYRIIAGMGRQYLDQESLDELVRWLDMLDRM